MEVTKNFTIHYPSADIPKQARQLYYQNRLRIIVDVNYQSIKIIPAKNPITNTLHINYCLLMMV